MQWAMMMLSASDASDNTDAVGNTAWGNAGGGNAGNAWGNASIQR